MISELVEFRCWFATLIIMFRGWKPENVVEPKATGMEAHKT